MKIKSYIFYCIIFLIIVAAKIVHTQATNDVLIFILKPISSIISLVLNSDFAYTNEVGFYFESLNITIDKSCSGINFWIISFAMFSVSLIATLELNFQRFLAIPLMLAFSFLLTLFANTSRILISILISRQTSFNYPWLHQVEGVFIYLSILILTYTIFNQFITKFNNNNAKLT